MHYSNPLQHSFHRHSLATHTALPFDEKAFKTKIISPLKNSQRRVYSCSSSMKHRAEQITVVRITSRSKKSATHSLGYFRRDTPACSRRSARWGADDRRCPGARRSRSGSPCRRTASCTGCRASGSSCCSAVVGRWGDRDERTWWVSFVRFFRAELI